MADSYYFNFVKLPDDGEIHVASVSKLRERINRHHGRKLLQ
jgi:hypothetical protein